MSVAKTIEISSQSPNSFEEAVQLGVERAAKTVKGIQGAWVKELKVDVENAKVTSYRVQMKVTFVLEG